MKYNNELQNIDTQEKAYLFGFLFGDGTISTYMDSNYKRFITKISIHEKDNDLLFKLKKYFPFFNLNKFDYSKYNKNSGKQISITNTSKALYYDLLSNGLYPRKSYENASKLKIPNINNKLISHFIRGFFDADGSVYVRTKRKNLISVEFCSVSFEFLNEINEYLKTLDINSWKIITKPSKNILRQTYYILSFIKTSEILKLINFMYNNSTISLKRKEIMCLKFKPINKVLERNMICPICNNNEIIKNGIRNNSIRYKCKNCKKGFSLKTS